MVSEKATFGEIDVQRINIIDGNGKVKIVFHNAERIPYPSPNRNHPGFKFFDDSGYECGGLFFNWEQSEDGKVNGGMGLAFDQYQSDQVVVLANLVEDDHCGKGLLISDRPKGNMFDWEKEFIQENGRKPYPLERETRRFFAGRWLTGEATVTLSDGKGNERIKISVDEDVTVMPKIEFMKCNGEVAFTISENLMETINGFEAKISSLQKRIDELQTLKKIHELEEQIAVLQRQLYEMQNKVRVNEIETERINVVSSQGVPRLILTNEDHAPDPITKGVTGKREGVPASGLYFYNTQGDECGALIYTSVKTEEAEGAGAGLLFDRYQGDQLFGFLLEDVMNGPRNYGLRFWERLDSGGSDRMYIGRTGDGEAVIIIHDSMGNPRVRLMVDSSDVPRFEMLDEEGNVVYSVPPKG